eukprot:357948-Chlamydomonas_euryale.AAC.3
MDESMQNTPEGKPAARGERSRHTRCAGRVGGRARHRLRLCGRDGLSRRAVSIAPLARTNPRAVGGGANVPSDVARAADHVRSDLPRRKLGAVTGCWCGAGRMCGRLAQKAEQSARVLEAKPKGQLACGALWGCADMQQHACRRGEGLPKWPSG